MNFIEHKTTPRHPAGFFAMINSFNLGELKMSDNKTKTTTGEKTDQEQKPNIVPAGTVLNYLKQAKTDKQKRAALEFAEYHRSLYGSLNPGAKRLAEKLAKELSSSVNK